MIQSTYVMLWISRSCHHILGAWYNMLVWMAYTHPIAWLCLIDTVWLHASNGFENKVITWWRHQMETISALLALCEGNSPATGEFPSQSQRRGVLMFFFYLRLNKRLSKQSRRWWFETPSRPLWHHGNIQWCHVAGPTPQITGNSAVFSTVCLGQHRRKIKPHVSGPLRGSRWIPPAKGQ